MQRKQKHLKSDDMNKTGVVKLMNPSQNLSTVK